MKKKIETKNAPGAIGPYSQGMIAGGMVFTSGQLPVDPASGEIPDTVQEQARISLENVRAVVEAAGSSMDQVIKTTVFIKNMDDFAKINEVYAQFFAEPFPARACVEVARLPKDALVEIECVALLG